MQYAELLTATYPKPSRLDCLTIALAAQEDCPLLTGDRDLRNAGANAAAAVE